MRRIIRSRCRRMWKNFESPETVKAQAYDLVLNGYELGGGSLRIYKREVQEKMFKALGFSAGRSAENNLDSC